MLEQQGQQRCEIEILVLLDEEGIEDVLALAQEPSILGDPVGQDNVALGGTQRTLELLLVILLYCQETLRVHSVVTGLQTDAGLDVFSVVGSREALVHAELGEVGHIRLLAELLSAHQTLLGVFVFFLELPHAQNELSLLLHLIVFPLPFLCELQFDLL